MDQIASRDLRNNTRALLDRVDAGEVLTITINGRPVAVLAPAGRRPRWISGDELVRRFGRRQADSGLTADLERLAPGTTDDLPLE